MTKRISTSTILQVAVFVVIFSTVMSVAFMVQAHDMPAVPVVAAAEPAAPEAPAPVEVVVAVEDKEEEEEGKSVPALPVKKPSTPKK
jgi:hypothetical protein